MRLMLVSEPVAARRRVYFDLRETDGITPATGEAGGQPQVSVDGAAWTNSGIGTLASVGFGRYYAVLATEPIAAAGSVVETRYKSGSTADCPGDSVQVVGFDPALNTAVADSTGRVKLMPAGLDDLSMVLLTAPVTFRDWCVWLILRFRRTRRVKASGILNVYGSNGSTVITSQVTSDNSTETVVGAVE
jgi:hypothetical protein